MVRLFGHLSSLNLPSWTRHSYGNQLQHWLYSPGAALEAGPSKYEKKTAVPSFFLSYSALLHHENYSSFAMFEFNNGHQEITSFHKFYFA